MNWAAVFWLALMLMFLMLEALTVGTVTIWFAGGALVALIVSLFHGQMWLQITLFAVVSTLLLASLRPIVKKYFTPKLIKTNTDALIGAAGRVTVAVDNVDGQGKIILNAMEWSARSTDGQPIPEGTLVKVDRIEGVKVYVTAQEEKVKI